jgi:hypothetical protein
VRRPRAARPNVDRSAFAGFRFHLPEVITVAVRWYLRYGLSYRDLEELLAERGVEVDHVSVFRWVQRFSPLFADAARPCRRSPGDRWFVDETYGVCCVRRSQRRPRGPVERLGGCIVVEPPVPLSSGPRLPGSGSHPR